MVQLSPEDIQAKDILRQPGLTLYHCQLSSSSQKVRIYLALKNLPYTAKHVEILTNEHLQPEYLAVNPRGLLPLLVDDGRAYIESNDIMLHLEEAFPDPPLIPISASPADRARMVALMDPEPALHFDLRKLSFRFLFNPPLPVKSEAVLAQYASLGSGTIQGRKDKGKDQEIAFWREYNDGGLSDGEARRIAQEVVRPQLDSLEVLLGNHKYLFGDTISILDITWIPFVQRFHDAQYPKERLHPKLEAWRARMLEAPVVARELELPYRVREVVYETQREWRIERKTLKDVCFPELQND